MHTLILFRAASNSDEPIELRKRRLDGLGGLTSNITEYTDSSDIAGLVSIN